jgi:hypothetical protein
MPRPRRIKARRGDAERLLRRSDRDDSVTQLLTEAFTRRRVAASAAKRGTT